MSNSIGSILLEEGSRHQDYLYWWSYEYHKGVEVFGIVNTLFRKTKIGDIVWKVRQSPDDGPCITSPCKEKDTLPVFCTTYADIDISIEKLKPYKGDGEDRSVVCIYLNEGAFTFSYSVSNRGVRCINKNIEIGDYSLANRLRALYNFVSSLLTDNGDMQKEISEIEQLHSVREKIEAQPSMQDHKEEAHDR